MAAITRNATNLQVRHFLIFPGQIIVLIQGQPPVHPNLADSLDAVRQMVDGFNTNNELLRTIIGNQPQPRVGTPAPTGTPPTRPERTDAPMNLDAEFVARAYRETPIKRSLRANALSVSFVISLLSNVVIKLLAALAPRPKVLQIYL